MVLSTWSWIKLSSLCMILTVMIGTIYEQEIQCHFDSLPPALTSSVMNQIAALLATPKDAIKVKYIRGVGKTF